MQRFLCIFMFGLWVFPALTISACDEGVMAPSSENAGLTSSSVALDEEVVIAPECDRDGDGFGVCTDGAPRDCDDNDWYTNPSQDERCDGLDNDCDSEIDEYITSCETATIPGIPAAEETDVSFDGPETDRPAAPEHPEWPDSCVDADHDGWPVCGAASAIEQDCDDHEWYTNPAQDELCDAADNDCDGAVDEYITGCETASVPGIPPAD